jgi:hypothetical protein
MLFALAGILLKQESQMQNSVHTLVHLNQKLELETVDLFMEEERRNEFG